MMGWFNSHEHTWIVDDYKYTPPGGRSLKIPAVYSEGLIERLLRAEGEGVTNVYLRCTSCGALDTKTVYGKYEPKKGS